jgi:MYXO-CTERM domain-containing protein
MGGPYLEVDTEQGTVTAVADLPFSPSDAAAALFTSADGYQVVAPGRTVQEQWERVGGTDSLHRLTLTASPPQNGERALSVHFPHDDGGGFVLMPGLSESAATSYPADAFEFEEGRISIPLPAGLLLLRDGLWLVAQTDSVHVAATFRLDGRVSFEDETLDPDGETQWVFWFFEGTEAEAVALARRLNVSVTAYLQTSTPEAGCGCGTETANPPAVSGIALLALGALARRISRRKSPSFSS